MDHNDPRYDNCFDMQLAALDQLRAVRHRLLPLHQRQRLDDIVRSFIGMQLAEAIDRVTAVGFDGWLRECVARDVAAIENDRSDHGEDRLLNHLFKGEPL